MLIVFFVNLVKLLFGKLGFPKKFTGQYMWHTGSVLPVPGSKIIQGKINSASTMKRGP